MYRKKIILHFIIGLPIDGLEEEPMEQKIKTHTEAANNNISYAINQHIINQKIQPVIHGEIQPIINKKIQPVIHGEIKPIIHQNIQPVIHKEIQSIIHQNIQPVIHREIQPITH